MLWNTGAATTSITVTIGGTYTVTQTTANGCTSAAGSGAAAPVSPKPTVTVVNNCNNTVLTATNYSGVLLWSTGENTQSISVTTSGTISVTQTVSACTSVPVSNNIIVYDSVNKVNFNVKLFLQGFYVGAGEMRAVYDPFFYPTLCDSIILNVHAAIAPYNLVYSIPGALDIYGIASFPAQIVPCGSYYLAIKHRNSVEIWNKNPFIVGNPATNIDFSR